MSVEQKRKFIIDVAYLALILALGYVALQYALPLLLPFVIAFVIAYGLRRPVRFLSRVLHVPKGLVAVLLVVLTYGLIGTLLVVAGIRLAVTVASLVEQIPSFYYSWILPTLTNIFAWLEDLLAKLDPSLMAVLNAKNPQHTIITVLADREEIGSDGNTGLNSEFMRYFIADLAQAEGLEPRHVLSKSKCLSADVTAAYDPTYASAYEKTNSTFLNNGIGMSKYTGSRGKSGTSEASAEFVAEIRSLFEENDVLWQIGELGKVDGGGGGTVAMFIANLNVDVLDVGVPVLSMHSPFEIVSKTDIYMTYKGIKAFFESKV